MVLHCLFDQVGSSVPDLDLSAVSFSAGEQNYLLVCDSQGLVEGLPKIPPAVKDYAAQVGQIPAYDKDTGLYVYFDNHLRLPVPDMTCSEIKKVAEKTHTPVYKLNAGSIPQEIMEFVNKQFSVITKHGVKVNISSVKGTVNTGSVGGSLGSQTSRPFSKP